MKKNKGKNLLNKKSVIFIVFVLFLIMMAVVLSNMLSDYSKIGLVVNKKDKFNVSDLTIDNLSYMSSEKDVTKKYGKPNNTIEKSINGFKYKIYKYDGLDVYLKEYYDTYNISKVIITSGKYTASSSIKVGNRIVSVINKFKVQNRKGEYIYANYSSDALNDETIKDEIEYGKRTKELVEYVSRDKIISDKYDIPINIAKLSVFYKKGKITKVIWSYDTK